MGVAPVVEEDLDGGAVDEDAQPDPARPGSNGLWLSCHLPLVSGLALPRRLTKA